MELSPEVKDGLNGLSKEEVKLSVNYAYRHNLLGYGVNAIAHVHLMRKAKEYLLPKILPLAEFIAKYGLTFDKRWGLLGPLKKIESDGIFVPRQKHWAEYGEDGEEDEIILNYFGQDYGNKLLSGEDREKYRYAEALMKKKWQPEDLENPELLEQGLRFGQDLWTICVQDFHSSKNGTIRVLFPDGRRLLNPPQPQKVTDLAERLIEYYCELLSV
jgi:hypothetical protein